MRSRATIGYLLIKTRHSPPSLLLTDRCIHIRPLSRFLCHRQCVLPAGTRCRHRQPQYIQVSDCRVLRGHCRWQNYAHYTTSPLSSQAARRADVKRPVSTHGRIADNKAKQGNKHVPAPEHRKKDEKAEIDKYKAGKYQSDIGHYRMLCRIDAVRQAYQNMVTAVATLAPAIICKVRSLIFFIHNEAHPSCAIFLRQRVYVFPPRSGCRIRFV